MYNSIAVIGIGTLGGHLVKCLSELECVKRIVLVDFDVVEPKNISNSIYSPKDIGRFKTDALKELITLGNDDIQIISLNEEFNEGCTEIPSCDLVIDCRDYIYDRGNIIDCRMYISSRFLICFLALV